MKGGRQWLTSNLMAGEAISHTQEGKETGDRGRHITHTHIHKHTHTHTHTHTRTHTHTHTHTQTNTHTHHRSNTGGSYDGAGGQMGSYDGERYIS